MKYKSYTVYDDDDFFQKYTTKRGKGNSPNDTLEKPIIDTLIGDIEGKKILDIGCGDGAYGKELLERGASHYHGIDGSENMIHLAKASTEGLSVTIEKVSVEDFAFPANTYDLILSRLVLHYIEDLEPVLEGIRKSLRPNASVVFSIEHPIITSCYEAYHHKTKRSHWIVDNYFHSGERVNTWIGKDVIKYHKTLEEYFELFSQTGFEISVLRESKPRKEHFPDIKDYERRMKIPLFLLFKLSAKS